MTFEELVNQVRSFETNEYSGICEALALHFDNTICSCSKSVSDFIIDYFPNWHSGDTLYPIADPDHDCPILKFEANSHPLASNHNERHKEYRSRRQTIFNKMKELHHLFTLKCVKHTSPTHNRTMVYYKLEYVGEQLPSIVFWR